MKDACFEITDKCPCNCIHCSSDYHADTFLPLNIIETCILDFAEMGGQHLELSGGDPTEHVAFSEILAFAHRYINNITVFSNNLKLDPDYFVQLLKKNDATLSFTILGTENTHNQLMGVSSYHKICALYQLCKSEGVPVSGHFVLMRPNMHEMHEVIAAFPEIKVLRLMPQGRAYDNWSHIQIRDAEIKQIFSEITYTGSHLKLPFCYEGKCNAGLTQFVITPLGSVVPCASFKRAGIKLGNVYKTRLRDIFAPSNDRLRLWQKLKTLFVQRDLTIQSPGLINPMCWGHYIHDGLKHPLAYDVLLRQFPTFDADFSRWIAYPSRRIYVSGAHGVGKSTLIDDIVKTTNVKFYENATNNPYTDDVYQRQLWRLYKYKYDDEMTKNLVNDVVLINRCPLDWVVYTNTFHTIGWLSDNEYEALMQRYHELFGGIYAPQHVYYLNPDIEWSQERIRERWESTGKKWRETDTVYYQSVRAEYNNVMGAMKSVARIDEITEIERISRVNRIKQCI